MFLLTAAVSAQVSNASIAAWMKRFPGVSRAHMEQLLTAKTQFAIPLPTWVPAGFSIERIKSRIGRRVSLEDREFVIIYSRKLANGRFQRFSIEAGFDGLGGLPYDLTKQIVSPVGKIDLMYEPPDPDGGGKLKNFAMTEWFRVGKVDFHYDGMHNEQEGDDPGQAMISLSDTERILRSLRRV